jgi:hypothetical protein
MHQKKHICGYPIWVENKQKPEQWITRFWDAPDGKPITRCPGCGGRLVPWEVKTPQAASSEDAQTLSTALANLIEAVEAVLYERHPDEVSRWADLTRQARSALDAADVDVAPPPWES